MWCDLDGDGIYCVKVLRRFPWPNCGMGLGVDGFDGWWEDIEFKMIKESTTKLKCQIIHAFLPTTTTVDRASRFACSFVILCWTTGMIIAVILVVFFLIEIPEFVILSRFASEEEHRTWDDLLEWTFLLCPSASYFTWSRMIWPISKSSRTFSWSSWKR